MISGRSAPTIVEIIGQIHLSPGRSRHDHLHSLLHGEGIAIVKYSGYYVLCRSNVACSPVTAITHGFLIHTI